MADKLTSGPIGRLGDAPMRRKAARTPFSGKVMVSSDMGEQASVPLRNISPFGCNIVLDADWLRTGRFVSLRLSAHRSIQAIVRWARNGSAGLEFLRPIEMDEADWLDNPA